MRCPGRDSERAEPAHLAHKTPKWNGEVHRVERRGPPAPGPLLGSWPRACSQDPATQGLACGASFAICRGRPGARSRTRPRPNFLVFPTGVKHRVPARLSCDRALRSPRRHRPGRAPGPDSLDRLPREGRLMRGPRAGPERQEPAPPPGPRGARTCGSLCRPGGQARGLSPPGFLTWRAAAGPAPFSSGEPSPAGASGRATLRSSGAASSSSRSRPDQDTFLETLAMARRGPLFVLVTRAGTT